MMSSTYEAVLEVATSDFKAYTVRRCVEATHQPRFVHPGLYFIELTVVSLGAALRAVGLVGDDPQTSPFPKEESGWCVRPVFEWDSPEFKPTSKVEKKARAALDATREQLQGGWQGGLKAAKMAVRRMQRRRDGVATRQAMYHITAANVGELEAKMQAQNAATNAKIDRTNVKIDRILAALGK